MAKTYSEVAKQLPADAQWSCSFGYPGEGGYTEYQRDSSGNKYVIKNGQFGDEWSIRKEPTTAYDVYLQSSGNVLVSNVSKTEAKRLTRGKKRGSVLAFRPSQPEESK